MQLHALVALLTLIGTASANDRHVLLAKKAFNVARAPSSSASTTTATSTTTTSSSSGSAPASAGTTTSAPSAPQQPIGTSIPPLSQITSGMPSQSTLAPTKTFSAGATPPISGAPALPTPCKAYNYVCDRFTHLSAPVVFHSADWPPQDQVAPTSAFSTSTILAH